AVTHDDNTGYDFAHAIEIGNAAAQVGPPYHLANVLDTDLRSSVAEAQRNGFKIRERTRVTAAANHVLLAAKFEQSSTGFVVAATNRLDHAANRDAVSPQTIWVEIYLVLACVTANWCNFGHARHRPEVIVQIPVLIRTQIGQAMFSRCIHQCVLKNPPESGSIRPKFGLNPLRQSW